MEASKKNGIVIKKANDHWAFLEDIEAPMWADLTLEAEGNSVGEDMSDDWFNMSHPFHQWSARQLKSKFSHPGEGILISEVDAQGLASPDLPSSVSRSRGKHYISKKWGGINLNILLDKQQGLSKRCFQAGSIFGQEVKPKSKPNISRPKGLFSEKKLGLALRNARGNAKSMANCRNRVSSLSSGENKTGESNTRSTITSENTHQQQKYIEVCSKQYDQKSRNVRSVSLRKSCVTKKASGVDQQQKCMDVSSQPCDQKSGSSSFRSVSLRKSCVTKKASRLEIGGDGLKFRGRQSSSGKSSVGSSSNPGYEVEFVSKHQREKITDVVTMNLADKKKFMPANISQTSTILVEGAKSSNRKGAKSRVEIGGDSMKSRGRKSSSGKSSVGSSSNSGYEVKFVPEHQRKKITDGKDVVTMNLADKNKFKPANISQTSTILVEGAKSSNRKGSIVSFAKPAYHRTAKSLVQYQSIGSRALLSGKVNKENFCSTGAKQKLRTSKVNSLTGNGKENAAKNATMNQKFTERVVPGGGVSKNHRTAECNHLQKGDTAGSSVLTTLGKDNDQREAKNPNNLSRRIYLRRPKFHSSELVIKPTEAGHELDLRLSKVQECKDKI